MANDPSDDKVSAATRAFEEEDEQVFAGAGRGPTRREAELADQHGEASPNVVAAYRQSIERGARQKGEGRIDL